MTDLLSMLKSWTMNNKTDKNGNVNEISISIQSITIEQSSSKNIADIYMWDNGLMDFHVFNSDSGEMILIKHHEIDEETSLNAVLEEYLNKLYQIDYSAITHKK